MARLRILVVAQETDGDVYALATCKFYAPGTATASGSSTSGTPFAGNLYAAIAGSSPISTTQTLGSNGTLAVWTTSKSRVDVGIEPAGGGTAFVRQYEAAELDPADVMTLLDTQLVLPTGTVAAPSLAQTGNLDTGFNVDSDGDPAIVKDGIGLFEALSTSTVMRSPDGGDVVSISNDGVFSTPGLLRMCGVYIATDEGIQTGSNNTNAASNTAALIALWIKAATAGGRPIYFPSGQYPFNASTTLNHALSTTVSGMGLYGNGFSSRIDLYGTAGPWFNIATASTSAISRGFVRDLRFQHMDIPLSGATLKLNATGQQTVEGLYMLQNNAGQASVYCVEIGGSVNTADFWLQDCKFETRSDLSQLTSDGVTPETLRITSSGSNGGLFLRRVDLTGCPSRSNGISFEGTGAWDTIEINGGLTKGHAIGLRTVGAGDITNFYMGGGHKVDEITSYGVLLQPPTGCDLLNWQFSSIWIYSALNHFVMDETASGSVTNVVINDSYLSGASAESISIGAGLNRVAVRDNHFNLDTTSGAYGIDVGGATGSVTDAIVLNNYVYVTSGAGGAVRISSNATPMHFGGGILRSKDAVIGGTLSRARVVTDYAFAA